MSESKELCEASGAQFGGPYTIKVRPGVVVNVVGSHAKLRIEGDTISVEDGGVVGLPDSYIFTVGTDGSCNFTLKRCDVLSLKPLSRASGAPVPAS